ncbi:MAG TPA: R3H domain-containing nucleic acid-binding protein [Thermoanaerobaculia bacterium]|nr:R3H domain-containing nucleic acid-binding protein [Thermoanaerobaculia bacterium]
MSGPARKFFSADTETLAVMEAAAHFGLAPAELAYRPVEKKHGFLRRPKTVIEVDPSSPRRAAGASTTAASMTAAPTTGPRSVPVSPALRHTGAALLSTPPPDRERQPSEVAARQRPLGSAGAGERLVELEPFPGPLVGLEGAVTAAGAVAALAGLRVSASGRLVSSPEGEDEWQVELAGGGRQTLLARQGELLHVCEHLARRMVRELPPGGLVLDSGGFRDERTRTLRRRAAAAAEEVRRSGEAVVFEPLPAAERRILHLAVEGEPGVASQSQGEGERRSVRIIPRSEDSPQP